MPDDPGTHPATPEDFPTRAAPLDSISPAWPGELDPVAGTEPVPDVPGYEVLGVLGQGAMGVVYRARDVRLDRVVALKVVRGTAPPRAELLRFLAEAAAVAAVAHDNVVRVFESGEHAGRPYMALEYLSGGTLARALERPRVAPGSSGPFRDAAALLAQIAHGVGAAHAVGIVHRDLKPSNVLFDAAGTPKVVDFGLAKRDGGSEVTATGQVLGTPAYMSPEQAQGDAKFVGPPADVWSLGVILYEALTGRRPFAAENPLRLLQQIGADEPAPPRALVPAVPRDLELICLKCLAKAPHERYPSAGELARELDDYLQNKPIRARRTGPMERAGKWVRRNRATSAAAAAVLLALAVGTGVSVGFAVEAGDQASRAEAEAARARQAAGAAEASADAFRRQEADARSALAQLSRVEGNRLTEAGDLWGAIHWFAESAAASPDDDRRARVHAGPHLRFARAPRLELVAPAPPAGPPNRVSPPPDVAFSPAGEMVAVLQPDGSDPRSRAAGPPDGPTYRLSLWALRDGRRVLDPVEIPSEPRPAIAFTADARHLVVTNGTYVRSLDARTGAWSTAALPSEPAFCALAPEGARLLVVARDGTARLFDPLSGEAVGPNLWQPTGVIWGHVNRAGTVALTMNARNEGRVWDTRTGAPLSPVLPHGPSGDGERYAALSPDGTSLAVSCGGHDGERALTVWDAVTGTRKFEVRDALPVRSVAFSPDGTKVLTCHGYRTSMFVGYARVWDAGSGHPLTPRLEHGYYVPRGLFAPDGLTVLTAGRDGALREWSVATGQPTGSRLAHQSELGALVPGPGGRFATADRVSVRCWRYQDADRATGKATVLDPELVQLWGAAVSSGGPRGDVAEINRRLGWELAAVSADGRFALGTAPGGPNPEFGDIVAEVSQPRALEVRDTTSGRPVSPRLGDGTVSLRGLSCGLDGQFVVVGLEEGQVVAHVERLRLLDARSGRPASPPLRAQEAVTRASFTRDGRWLVAECARAFGPTKRAVVMFDLGPEPRPWSELLDLAALHTGTRTDATGRETQLRHHEYLELYTRARARHPDDFATDFGEDWFSRAAAAAAAAGDRHTEAFCLQQLHTLRPADDRRRRLVTVLGAFQPRGPER